MSNDLGGGGPNVPVVPYSPDGGCSALGWGLMLGASTATGVVIGALAGFVSQWFYLVLFFPLGMGVVIGSAGIFAIKQGKVRSEWLAIFAGCLAACATVWGMHYTEYQLFLAHRASEVGEEDLKAMIEVAEQFEQLKARRDELDENLRDFIQFLEQNPLTLRSLQVKNFWDHLELAAHEGVTITSTRAGGGGGMNLGYVGSYIYWAGELLVIAVIAFCMMSPAASEPFCLGCENWKEWQPLGCLTPDPHAAKAALSSGDLGALARLSPTAFAGHYMVTAAVCPRCGEQSPADLKLEEVTVNEKNEPVRKNLLLVTYPGEALPLIRKMFDDGAAQAIAEAEAAETEVADAGQAPDEEGSSSG